MLPVFTANDNREEKKLLGRLQVPGDVGMGGKALPGLQWLWGLA